MIFLIKKSFLTLYIIAGIRMIRRDTICDYISRLIVIIRLDFG